MSFEEAMETIEIALDMALESSGLIENYDESNDAELDALEEFGY